MRVTASLKFGSKLRNSFSERNYTDQNLLPFTVYSYRIQSFNDQGSTLSKPAYVSVTYPSTPCCSFEYSVSNIRSKRCRVTWTRPERLNGLNMFYLIELFANTAPGEENVFESQSSQNVTVSHESLVAKNSINDSYLQYELDNLSPYTKYFITVKACNRDLFDPQLTFCLNGTVKLAFDLTNGPSPMRKLLLEFFTSQDRPEQQPSPSVLQLNTNNMSVMVTRPQRPNGIILLYEVWVRQATQLSNTTVNSSSVAMDSALQPWLACAIEEWYDPNDQQDVNEDAGKFCVIHNLVSNTEYTVSASSSTIIGRSELSPELAVKTLEDFPSCPARVTSLASKPNEIFLEWVTERLERESSFYGPADHCSFRRFPRSTTALATWSTGSASEA